MTKEGLKNFRRQEARLKMDATQFQGWMPIRLHWQAAQPVLDWCFVGDERFTEPFFDQTVQRLLRHPFNQLFRQQTPLETLAKLHERAPGLAPTGFIFHMSRCGSTLISQMLAALPQNIVISEAAPVDAVLRAHLHAPCVTDDERVRWLQWIVSALGRRRAEQAAHYFIKFDAWHTIDLPLIARAFPGVPWVFVGREPTEVIVSHLKRRGAHTLPWVVEPQLFGLDMETAVRVSPVEYCARVLAAICRAALAHYHSAGAGLILDYRQLPGAIESHLLDFFRVSYTEEERRAMRDTARFDAKNPALPFADDGAAKRRAVTADIQQAAAHWLDQLYAQLADLAQKIKRSRATDIPPAML
ncbi:MAG: sulfotransferase family protein [Pyrinomonadaceae bacterium]